MNKDAQKFKYHAFISYRHADNKKQGRQWATWLHQAIETYEVPNDLVGKTNGRGDKIPARIYPIFRDEEELPADADLGNSIVNALEASRILIVLCSPQAVASTYVADEIHHFKKIGRSDSIIAALLYGEPNASWDVSKQSTGFVVDDECFPTPLQFEYENGVRSKKRAEPIAADFRINVNGKIEQGWTSLEAYRQSLESISQLGKSEIQKKLDQYQQQQHLMLLKIIAGVLGVPLGELTQRDKEYQLEIAKEKAKKLRRWLSAVAMLAVIAVGAGVLAFLKQKQAVKAELVAVEQRQVAEKNLAEAYAGYGRQELADKQFENALTYFLYANQLNSKAVSYKEEYQAFKQSAKKSWNRTLGLRFDFEPYVTNNSQFVIGAQENNIVLYDLNNHQKIYSYHLPDSSRFVSMVSDDGENIVEYNLDQQEFRMLNWKSGKVTSLNYLKDYKFVLAYPHDSSKRLLVISFDGSFRIVNPETREVYSHVTAEDIDAVQSGYISDIKKDTLKAMNRWTYHYHKGVRTLVYDTGMVIRFDLNKPKVSSTITPSFLGDYANNLRVSFDGKLLASVEYSFCLLNETGDLLKIAKEVDVWDLESKKKVNSLALNWSVDINKIYLDPGCDKDNYDVVISKEIRQDVIAINNQLADFEVLNLESSDKVNLAWDSIVQDSTESIPMMDYRKRPFLSNTVDILRSRQKGAWAYQLHRQSESDIEKNAYWLYEIGDLKKDTKISTDVIDMTTSVDDRFINVLTAEGSLFHYFSATGGQLKVTNNSAFQSDFPASSICPTESSHELIMSSSYQVWRYNWLEDKIIWHLDLTDIDASLFSCESNIKKGEFSLVFLDRTNPWNTQLNLDKVPVPEDNSRIIRIDMQGNKLSEPDLSKGLLNFPLQVKYTPNFGEMYISQIGGTITLYDFLNDKVSNRWLLEKDDNFSSVSAITVDHNTLDVYAGYTNGKVYRLDPKERVRVAKVPMPIIGMMINNQNLIIDTGFNPKIKKQNSFLINLAKNNRKSYSYQLNLKDSKLHKIRGYGENKSKFVNYLSNAMDKVLFFDSGNLSGIKPSSIESVVLAYPQKEDTSLSYYKDFEPYILNREIPGLEVRILGKAKSGLIPAKSGQQILHGISNDRNWMVVSVANDIYSHRSFLLNSESLDTPVNLGDFDLPVQQSIEMIDFSHDGQKIVICGDRDCKIYSLNQKVQDIDITIPFATIEQPELFSRIRFADDDLLVTTLSGKLQRWQWKGGDYILVTEKNDNYYKGVFFDHRVKKAIVVTRKGGLILSSDLTLIESEIEHNFNSNPIVAIDLNRGWALTVNSNFDSFNLSARLVDLKSGTEIVYQQLPISAVPSLFYDQERGKIFWTSLEGELVSWNVDKAYDNAINYVSKDYSEKIIESRQNNNLEISGISLEKSISLIQSKNYGDFLGFDHDSYHTWNFNDSWIKRNGTWAGTTQTLFDIQHWNKTLDYKGEDKQQIAKQLAKSIEQLENKIAENLSNNLDVNLLVEQLKKIEPQHFMVDYIDIQKTSKSNPYTAFVKGNKLLRTIDQDGSHLEGLLVPRLMGLVMSSAVLSGKFYEAYEIYMSTALILVPPQITQQVFTQLSINGYYTETLSMLDKEIDKLKEMDMDQETSFAYQGYQFLLRYKDIVKPLAQRRTELPNLPTLCLNDVQDGSVLNISEWKKGDCIVTLNDKNLYEGVAFWKELQQALGQTNSHAKIWRNGEEIKVKIPNSINGGMWQSMGYNGQYVLKINAINDKSIIKDLGVKTFDYLVAIDDQILSSPAMLAHHISTDNFNKTLWIFRPNSSMPLTEPNKDIIAQLKHHPLSYRQGELFSVELPKDQNLGIAIEPFQILSPKEIP